MPFPVEAEYIDAAERELGLQLPGSYRAKLMRVNGGSAEVEGDTWILHPVFDRSSRKTVTRTANHIVQETRSAREWSGFPARAVSIAENGTGDRLVLLPERPDTTRLSDIVYWWDHETGECNTTDTQVSDID